MSVRPERVILMQYVKHKNRVALLFQKNHTSFFSVLLRAFKSFYLPFIRKLNFLWALPSSLFFQFSSKRKRYWCFKVCLRLFQITAFRWKKAVLFWKPRTLDKSTEALFLAPTRLKQETTKTRFPFPLKRSSVNQNCCLTSKFFVLDSSGISPNLNVTFTDIELSDPGAFFKPSPSN